jgi:hypothetical protein
MAILGGGAPPRYVSEITPKFYERNRLIVKAEAKWTAQGSETSSQLPEEELMIITSRTLLRTTHYLTPVIYTYGMSGIVIKDILEPRMFHIPYVLSSIGGEAIKKEGEIIGVVYINRTPVDLIVSKKITAHLKDRRFGIEIQLKKVTFSVSNITAFVTKLWSRGIEDDSELRESILERIQWDVKEIVKSYSIDDVFERTSEIKDRIKSIIASAAQDYNLNLVDIVLDIEIQSPVREYYYWHRIKGIPEEVPYVIDTLKKLKDNVPELLEEVGPLITLALLSRDERVQKLGEVVLERLLQKDLSQLEEDSE